MTIAFFATAVFALTLTIKKEVKAIESKEIAKQELIVKEVKKTNPGSKAVIKKELKTDPKYIEAANKIKDAHRLYLRIQKHIVNLQLKKHLWEVKGEINVGDYATFLDVIERRKAVYYVLASLSPGQLQVWIDTVAFSGRKKYRMYKKLPEDIKAAFAELPRGSVLGIVSLSKKEGFNPKRESYLEFVHRSIYEYHDEGVKFYRPQVAELTILLKETQGLIDDLGANEEIARALVQEYTGLVKIRDDMSAVKEELNYYLIQVDAIGTW